MREETSAQVVRIQPRGVAKGVRWGIGLRDRVDPVGVGGQRVVGLDGPGVERRRSEDGVDELSRAAHQRRVEVNLAGHAPRLIGRPEQIRRLRVEPVGTVPPAQLEHR